jgi:RecB family endonuclease NucS
VEYPTAVGSIDILAVDGDGGFAVFELKLDRGPDRALGQLARYMGWVKVNLAGARPVSGVVVARSIDERLRYAVSVIPSVVLLEYEVEFRVREVAAFNPTQMPASSVRS